MMDFKTEPTDKDLLKVIFNYIPQIAMERDLDNMLILLADLGRDLVTADRCTVWLLSKKKDKLWTKVAHGVDRIVIPSSFGIAGHVAQNCKELIINDPYSDPRFDKEVDKKTGYKTKSIIAIPILDTSGEMIGVFQAINKMTARASFDENDLKHLLLATSYTGKQLEAAFLQEEIETTQKEIIFTLAETGELRSKETGNHVKRVATYSHMIAMKYGIPKKECDLLKLASPLHDIGKIAIPDRVLLKPGKLDKEEWVIMQSHAQLGYDMLRHSDRRILNTAAIIAYGHHEKWNGTGYPNKIAGDKIHIFGRITAIADVFDALASDRVYKKAWALDKVFDLFKEERGQHFDPDLADIMLKDFDEFVAVKDKLKD